MQNSCGDLFPREFGVGHGSESCLLRSNFDVVIFLYILYITHHAKDRQTYTLKICKYLFQLVQNFVCVKKVF